MSENQIALKNLVSMETLTNEEVMALIKRGIEFKNGAKAILRRPNTSSQTFSLNLQLVPTKPLKWQS